ncbi:hypothetical protein [Algibacter mikhailovii]|uniref:Uncharacterized protein n=1 Tax=Algibacter mikhailovii TaxID=425498 RepID=A0A918V774_9FLAO|nr:hypothetical protein [Algibacter mikhailovii]GGZ72052.1 hypothetical protein GCM10007028_06770 [Algibacter mikhailovii]
MIEREYLKYCLDAIEKKLDWKPSSNWTESDFKRLANIISEESNISISSHTLKRLYGKLAYKAYYNPQIATKDALVKFLGYSDWQSFVITKKQQDNTSVSQEYKVAQKNSVKWYYVLLGALFLLTVMVVFQSQKDYGSKNANDFYKFKVIDSIGTVPFTIRVDYNLSKFNSDSSQIDFGVNHPIRGRQIVIADTSRYIHNFTYQIPGYYDIELLRSSEVIASKRILAKSKGWNSYFLSEANKDAYWIDNEIKHKDSSGHLYFSPKLLKQQGFDTNSVYYITNRLYKNFDIDGDNFELLTRFKNSNNLGGITCYDFILRLICANNFNYLKLMEAGCSQFSGIKIGDKVFEGTYEDLSSFSFDKNRWNILRLAVKNNKVKIIINDKLIYEFQYEASNGQILGLEQVFKGSGSIDYIYIKDLNTNKEFVEHFNL